MREDRKTLQLSGRTETLIDAHEVLPSGSFSGPDQGRSELKGISGAQRMNTEKPFRPAADFLYRQQLI